jgi:predicted phosphodiesterase
VTDIRIGLIPDAHIPFHSERRLRALFDAIRGCDVIVVMGDWLDAYSVSSFDKNPARKERMADEFAEGRRLLRVLRDENPDAEIHFIEGNHESRFMRYLFRNAPALVGMRGMSIREQLDLDELNITHHGEDGFTLHGIRLKHGQIVRAKSGATAHAELDSHGTSGISGHTHRMSMVWHTNRDGDRRFWLECGHVCDESKADYCVSPNWQAGSYMLFVDADTGTVDFAPIWLD